MKQQPETAIRSAILTRLSALRTPDDRTPFSYLAKLTEEFLEAARALNDAEAAGSPLDRDSYLEDAATELLQTSAVALSMAQSIRSQLVANNSKEAE